MTLTLTLSLVERRCVTLTLSLVRRKVGRRVVDGTRGMCHEGWEFRVGSMQGGATGAATPCTRVAQAWYRECTAVVQAWYRCGTRVVSFTILTNRTLKHARRILNAFISNLLFLFFQRVRNRSITFD